MCLRKCANGLNQYEETELTPASFDVEAPADPEAVVATSYGYDANGSLTSTARWSYRYDAENRLLEAFDEVDLTVVRFAYDGKGRRISKQVDETVTAGYVPSDFTAEITYEYLYEGDEPIQDYLKAGSDYVINHRYIHGASVDERLVHWQYNQNTGAEEKEHYYHRDHQGSIVAVSDASGNRPEGELYTYDAYGNQVTGNETGQPFRYTGRRYDAETGLYYYRARYYSSDLGRFLQTDPIGYEDNMNLYAYVGNDPFNNTDPTGKVKIKLSLKGSVFLGLGVKAGISLSFDTSSLEIGGSVSAGVGVGFGGSVGGDATIGASGDGPARNSGNLAASVDATVNAGPVTAQTRLANFDEGKTTTIADKGLAESSSGGGRKVRSLGLPSVKLSPKVGLTANVAVSGRAEGTTSVIPDTINAAKSALNSAESAISGFLEQADKAVSKCIAGNC